METLPITRGGGWVKEAKSDVKLRLGDGGKIGCYLFSLMLAV